MNKEFNGLEQESAIDLAREPAFRLGRVTIRPELRQVVREDDGAEEVVEPRIMQVLVALAKADGGIVTRDQLVAECWEGRVVGEDAVNRAISRVRKLAEGIGKGSFKLETVTKVGYRLIPVNGAATPAASSPARQPLGRRSLLVGGALLGAAALGGGFWFLGSDGRPETPPPASVAPLMEQGMLALRQGTAESSAQAMGLFRRVTEMEPDYADGWGALAMVYAGESRYGSAEDMTAAKDRSLAAIRRARELDPDNGYAQAAEAWLKPSRGNWLVCERLFRASLASHPDNETLRGSLADVLSSVGRIGESADLIGRMVATSPPSPGLLYRYAHMLWAASRFEEADRAMDQAYSLYPRHFAVWFSRCYMLMYTGRARQAIAQAEDRGGRPPGLRDYNFDIIIPVARAMVSRRPAEIDRAVAMNLEAAHQGSGYAENAIQFASALGRPDTAFAIAEAYYFSRGFTVPDIRFDPEMDTYTRMPERRTYFLFIPSTEAMRADPRFDALTGELGLKDYWAKSGSKPDYQKVA